MKRYTFYDEQGEIKQNSTKSTPPDLADYPAGWKFKEGRWEARTHYFLDDEPTVRPSMGLEQDKTEIAADLSEVVTVTNIPEGAAITIHRQQMLIMSIIADNSGYIELTAALPGEYRVNITDFPFVDEEFVFNAN